jgi:thiol:disulfide interchange protein DsbD
LSATPFTFSQSPVSINDPTFGQVPVFTQKSVVATTTLMTTNGKGARNAPIVIGWQGCAKAGLCYPPEKIKTTVNIGVARK